MDDLHLVAFKWDTLALSFLFEAYNNGSFSGYKRKMSEEEFLNVLKEDMAKYSGFWLILSSTTPIAFGFSKYDGWAIEPHVEFFPETSIRTIMAAYRLFFQEVLRDPNIQVCLIRCYEKNKRVFESFVKEGLMTFLRHVRYSTETEYQYIIAKQAH